MRCSSSTNNKLVNMTKNNEHTSPIPGSESDRKIDVEEGMSLHQPRQYRVKHTITLSASEVEFNDLVVTALEARGVHSLLTELIGTRRSVVVECDNTTEIKNR